ncbi:MAG: glycosyltransferase family 4 protein [Spirochaetia bacterium]|nr:glycosyltransferase family 4 protein [Spirochaetia bacterium]
MKIGVDARPLAFPRNGNARYLFDMLMGLLSARKPDCYVLYSHRPIHSDYRTPLERRGVTFREDTSWTAKTGLLFLNTRVIQWLRQDQCDLYWGSLSMLPLFFRARAHIPCMVNFHDLNAYSAPETMTFANRIQHLLTNGHTLRNADSVLCLSQTTADDIAATFPWTQGRLELVYPGVELKPLKPRKPESIGLKAFYLMVSTIEPRKNQGTVVTAYRNARKKSRTLLPLVVVGRQGWGSADLHSMLASRKLESEGIFYIEEADDSILEWCYARARLYLFPSLHEGFGLPILEAGFRNIPMALSDIPIFREVAPSAAFAPPLDVAAWEALLNHPPRKGIKFKRKDWTLENRSARILEIAQKLVLQPRPRK